MLRKLGLCSILTLAGCQSGGPFPDFVSSGPATVIRATGPCGDVDYAGTKNIGQPYYRCTISKDGVTSLEVGAISSDAAIVVGSAFTGATNLVQTIITGLGNKGATP